MTLKNQTFAGKKVSILGLARSGMQVALLMKSAGAIPFVSDYSSYDYIRRNARFLEKSEISHEIGGHSSEVYRDKDLIIVSPGISMTSPVIKMIQKHKPGITIVSEIEIAYYFSKGKIIAVTGSNGKSTTVSLIGQMLADAGYQTFVGGNIGNPFSTFVLNTTDNSFVVLEVSSFQLETIIDFKPWISVILNLTPDHLDRYPDLDSYFTAKLRIFENQGSKDFLVLNHDDAQTMHRIKATKPSRFYYSRFGELDPGIYIDHDKIHYNSLKGKSGNLISINEVGLKGPHNLWNLMAAASVGLIVGIPSDSLNKTFSSFKGIEHRMEEIGEINGIKFVNDSKATNVDSVAFALQSYQNKIILILGGMDKGGKFEDLSGYISEKVPQLILLGDAKDKIGKTLKGIAPIRFVDSMDEAVRVGYEAALEASEGGGSKGIVLLSPGCASFDMYKNFEYRGWDFKEKFNNLKFEIEE